jgi:hypothetical protein
MVGGKAYPIVTRVSVISRPPLSNRAFEAEPALSSSPLRIRWAEPNTSAERAAVAGPVNAVVGAGFDCGGRADVCSAHCEDSIAGGERRNIG